MTDQIAPCPKCGMTCTVTIEALQAMKPGDTLPLQCQTCSGTGVVPFKREAR